MGIFGSIKKAVSGAAKVVTKPVAAVAKVATTTVRAATAKTPIGGVVKSLTSVKISANPLATIKSVAATHAAAGKFLFSKEAGAIGLAAVTGGATAAAAAAGGPAAAKLVAAAKSGNLSMSSAADLIKGNAGSIVGNAVGALTSGKSLATVLQGAGTQLYAAAVGDVVPKPAGSKLPLNAGKSVMSGISQSTALAPTNAAAKEDIITTLIKLPFRLLGLAK